MNAVRHVLQLLPRRQLSSLWERCGAVVDPDLPTPLLREQLTQRFALGFAELLNAADRPLVESIARIVDVDCNGDIGQVRADAWVQAALLEAGGSSSLGMPWQRVPIVLGGKLVSLGEVRGSAPPQPDGPRPVPALVPSLAAIDEPESLDELLANASRLLGARLGSRGRDKGFFGARIARLLGLVERGLAEPDWRGEVEVKTLAVEVDPAGWWRVREDPAICMENVDPMSKLRRVLWICRVADREAAVLSWYYQESDSTVERWIRRDLHLRPKGPKGTDAKGWYLHKGFFIDNGLLASLNGS